MENPNPVIAAFSAAPSVGGGFEIKGHRVKLIRN